MANNSNESLKKFCVKEQNNSELIDNNLVFVKEQNNSEFMDENLVFVKEENTELIDNNLVFVKEESDFIECGTSNGNSGSYGELGFNIDEREGTDVDYGPNVVFVTEGMDSNDCGLSDILQIAAEGGIQLQEFEAMKQETDPFGETNVLSHQSEHKGKSRKKSTKEFEAMKEETDPFEETNILNHQSEHHGKSRKTSTKKRKRSLTVVDKDDDVDEDIIIDISELLKCPFGRMNLRKKRQIIKKGRPTPLLPGLKSSATHDTDNLNRFSHIQYERVSWLTGCEKLNKLFCWPCLLFSTKRDYWSKSGINDLKHLPSKIQNHEKDRAHIQSFLELKLFHNRVSGKTVVNKEANEEVLQHNDLVKQNRKVFQRFVSVILLLAKQNIPFRKDQNDFDHEDDEYDDPSEKDNYVALLEFVGKYDPALQNHLSRKNDFLCSTPDQQNDLISAISNVVSDALRKDLHESDFVSIVLYEIYDILPCTKVAVLLRYFYNCKLNERFVGFIDISETDFFKQLQMILTELEIKDKIVSQTFIGISALRDKIIDLQRKILKRYPRAVIAHYHTQDPALVLHQILDIKECLTFFALISSIKDFFSQTPRNNELLINFIDEKFSSEGGLIQWDSPSLLISNVRKYRVPLLQFFEDIYYEQSLKWSGRDLIKSLGVINFLNEFRTIFLLEVVYKIFNYVEVLVEGLDSILDGNKEQILTVEKQLYSAKDIEFDAIWEMTVEKSLNDENLQSDENHQSNGHIPEENERSYYKRIYLDIINNVSTMMKSKYDFVSEFEFSHILNTESKFASDVELEQKLKNVYGSSFDYIRLKSEVEVLNSNPEICGKTIHEMLQFFGENDLQMVFKEIFKLAALLLTIPLSKSCMDEISPIGKILWHCRETKEREIPDGLSLLAVECHYVEALEDHPKFYEDVLTKFMAQKSRPCLKFL